MTAQDNIGATAVQSPVVSAFPVDWDEWRKEWNEWQRYAIGLNRYRGNPFPGKNFLADEVLGVYRVGGRIVELSEVTMPDFHSRNGDRVRYVGVTYWENERCENGGIVSSFQELETALGLSPEGVK